MAERLTEANRYLKENYGLRIKIFDGYRPLSAEKIMWELLPNENYVVNPAKGSRHNGGGCGRYNINRLWRKRIEYGNRELNMGTAYADFSEKARYNLEDLQEEI